MVHNHKHQTVGRGTDKTPKLFMGVVMGINTKKHHYVFWCVLCVWAKLPEIKLYDKIFYI